MLRIAVPNKGSLSGPAAEMLHEAGYQQRRESKELRIVDPVNEVEFFYLRPRDIAIYVASGRLDIGITGRDLLIDSGADAEEILPLGFARSTFRYAAKPGTVTTAADLAGTTVATSYEGIVAAHLAEHGIDASVVHLDGAVETAIQLGVAEVIADVVETGTSLRNAGLEVVGEPIMTSEAVVILPGLEHTRPGDPTTGADGEEPKVQQFLRRLQGVLVARTYVMMDYDCRVEQLEKAVALTPAWSPRPCRPCTTRAGSPSGRWSPPRRRSGSWTTCTTSGPAPSSPRPSTPAASDRAGEDRHVRHTDARTARHLPAGRHPRGAPHRGRRTVRRRQSDRAAAVRARPGERISFVFTAALLAGVLFLLARPKVVADETGVTVVNIVNRRRLAWPEILQVNLRSGDPWVFLDLSDGTSMPVLGIQPGMARQRAVADARALRALAEAHSAPEAGAARD